MPLFSFEASWNSLDVATFNVSCTRHQKWATSYFTNGPTTWSWFSVNTEALGFQHRLMCSSLRSWILCLQRHGFVFTSKIEQVVYLDATESTRIGKSRKKWNTRYEGLWFSIDKLLTCRNRSITCSLRYALLSVATAGCSLVVSPDNASTHTLREWDCCLQLVLCEYWSNQVLMCSSLFNWFPNLQCISFLRWRDNKRYT